MSSLQRYVDPVYADVEVQEDLVFRTVRNHLGDLEDLRLDVYSPAGDESTDRPAILWIHGGGFRPGNDKRQRYIVRLATAFAQRGHVGFACDYRVRDSADEDRLGTLRDAVDDCRAALEWVRTHAAEYRVDPTVVAVAGGSAGGMAGTSLCALEAQGGRPGVYAFANLWGSPREGFSLAPIDRSYPPTMLVHGTGDQLVAYANAVALESILESRSVPHRLLTLEGAPHTPMAHLDEIADAVARFLDGARPPRA